MPAVPQLDLEKERLSAFQLAHNNSSLLQLNSLTIWCLQRRSLIRKTKSFLAQLHNMQSAYYIVLN